MHGLYSVLYGVAAFALYPFELKKRSPELRERWKAEKFGHMTPRSGDAPALWLHAVSVGEAIASAPFLRAFKERHPEYDLIISTITDTGQAVATERLGDIARIVYLPFDMRSALDRAVRALRPTAFAVMETEIWPNLFRSMKDAGVPVVMLNGRISEKSFKGYLKVSGIVKKILQDVDLFCMQDEVYAKRIGMLGADENKIENTGTFKFDIKVKDKELPWLEVLGSPIVVVGSTHRGEDALMVRSFREVLKKFPRMSMVLAPRHPERFNEVEKLIRDEGASCIRRSSLEPGGDASGAVVLLDTVGELSSVYRAADIAVMGGSFIRHGGQNPLEAAYWGKPVVCGPHMWNFPFVEEFHAEGAAVRADEDTLSGVLEGLLSDTERASAIGKRAKDILQRTRGAVERALDAVDRIIRD